ncbi:N-6 adenine-specific DNA methyltransferase 2 [Perkinsus olseni]|uniref:N-6 adenine-specific DNA methyltransferase 2 n=1 Tax=Perkinsus olseni TaxID=32597 RepID=A0A7J6LY06_PEROL|nr:N-6 adenine-specific DNA methyltransferase 2 [Perkinsus olseni]
MTKTKPFSIREKVEFNQYWYSRKTIETLVDELLHLQQRQKPDGPLRVACLSTPSVYFTLTTAPEISDKLECWFFDFDPHLLQGERCVKFDYHEPKNVPVDLCHTFDCVLIDPPFITKEVWENYATTAKLLAASGAHFIGSSVRENGELLHELLEMISVPFQPSIPNLVYQYDFFTNYPPEGPFRHVNSEV